MSKNTQFEETKNQVAAPMSSDARHKAKIRDLKKMTPAELREEYAIAKEKFEKRERIGAVNRFNLERFYEASKRANATFEETGEQLLSLDAHLTDLQQIVDAKITNQPPRAREEAAVVQEIVREDLQILLDTQNAKPVLPPTHARTVQPKDMAYELIKPVCENPDPQPHDVLTVCYKAHRDYKTGRIDAKVAYDVMNYFEKTFFSNPNTTREKTKFFSHADDFIKEIKSIVRPEDHAERLRYQEEFAAKKSKGRLNGPQ